MHLVASDTPRTVHLSGRIFALEVVAVIYRFADCEVDVLAGVREVEVVIDGRLVQAVVVAGRDDGRDVDAG